VAGNGKEALAALDDQAFDVVLMDVQMPEMDGLEATAAIRAREQGTGRHIPIIAMTAFTLKGDQERCLAAGMDGYIPKPTQPWQILQAIDSAVPNVPEHSPETGIDVPAEANASWEEALAEAGGDRDLLARLARLFLETYPEELTAIRAAINQGDAWTLQNAAHTLKSELSTFAAWGPYELALRLEMMARQGEVDGAPVTLATLLEEIARVRPALAALASNARECAPRA
jgi:CheY-like chemotaxis protein/HPt (histidine-containing phosphotransfer) domain-containing protein